LIAAGFTGLVLRDGFNLGIDFTGGVSKQIQIAPPVFAMDYTEPGRAQVNISGGRIQVDLERGAETSSVILNLRDYATVADVASALGEIPGLSVEVLGSPAAAASSIISLNFPVDISGGRLVVNRRLAPDEEVYAAIDEVRAALVELGAFTIQVAGEPRNQEFILKVPTSGEDDRDFLDRIDTSITGSLGEAFGADHVLLKKTDFVGAVFSEDLARAAVWSILVALVLILVYITFRFRFVFAAAAIMALVHDVSFMLGVIGTFQLEVTSTTIAAVLTIIGYSLNDTIVVFDRVRENVALMPEAGRADVIDTSITQSLSRTTITSITTLLAVIAIYVFGTGIIKDFALNLIVGVVIGTYSSIFIAAPIVLGWQNVSDRRKRAREAGRTSGVPLRTVKGAAPAEKPAKDVKEKKDAAERAETTAAVEKQYQQIRQAMPEQSPHGQRKKKKKKKKR